MSRGRPQLEPEDREPNGQSGAQPPTRRLSSGGRQSQPHWVTATMAQANPLTGERKERQERILGSNAEREVFQKVVETYLGGDTLSPGLLEFPVVVVGERRRSTR